ncbi:AAA family ATPase [Cryptosporangium arvum]|uniref:MoxR-like ATPase n=1 Tax=Cryptosporangium arvum DSM 44712 TaxID=927661 RepID=A0A010YHW4_9ACTN|nr:MoxR family ATPase [Cryptosporangium arvum]EXG79870.1 MoxR-like ATPase [Cryptosporangium arvum DSM 44712]
MKMRYTYNRIFDPPVVAGVHANEGSEPADDKMYVFDDEDVILAVNLAIASGRPLLVYGPAGSGKSALAPNIARELQAPLFSQVMTSRTDFSELLWKFDSIKRLADAQTQRLLKEEEYVVHGVLWEALASQANPQNPVPAVVLLDEIDKASPDLPNGLLGPLGSLSFRGPQGNDVSSASGKAPLIIITSNNDRELSRPFLRRCVVVTLKPPTKNHLMGVAAARFGKATAAAFEDVASAIGNRYLEPGAPLSDLPSTGEFLDAIRASIELDIRPETPAWRFLSKAILAKYDSVQV